MSQWDKSVSYTHLDVYKRQPTLSTLADSGMDQVSEKLIGKSVKDCIDSWGRSEQTWKTEDGQKGYLWFCDQDKTTLILYSDNSGTITSIAISREVMLSLIHI